MGPCSVAAAWSDIVGKYLREIQKSKAGAAGQINLAEINSREKAEVLVGAGALRKLFLIPPEFGGEESPLNTTFAPPAVVEQKEDIDQQVIGGGFANGSD